MIKMRYIAALSSVFIAAALWSCGDSSFSSDTEQQSTTAVTASMTETADVTEQTANAPEPTEAETLFQGDDGSYVEYHFRSEKLLTQHFEKHGAEFDGDFDYDTAAEYEKGASDVINNAEALYKTEAEDGDGVYYIESTNEFVILSTDGYIRTYFRPNDGINYYNRQ